MEHNGLYELVIDKKDTQWYDRAACKGTDPESFFVEDRGCDYTNVVKTICKSCPVKNECLNFAVKYRMQGYWGGSTEQERRRMRRYNMVA
jgi:WhiB family redox-sensing transcriptional regulator